MGYIFEPETGCFDYLAKNINEWCDIILKDYNILTGYRLAHTWQQTYGKIPAGYRLIPKIPFVAGGEYATDNLYLEQSVMAMKVRANIALQIKDIPDGNHIQLKLKHQEYDIVRAKKNLSEKVLKGCKGVIVMLYEEPTLGYEVEFINDTGETIDVLTVYSDDIE